MRGDLIETFKEVRGFVNYGQSLFTVSRSGLNLLSRGNKVSRSRKDFLGERVVNYCGVLCPLQGDRRDPVTSKHRSAVSM